ncbi:MAG: alpha/beta hydrolase [Gemmatimonadaceae bacterium]
MLATVVASGLLVVVVLVTFWWQQERVVFRPTPPPFPTGSPARRIEYSAEDGRRLFALMVGDPSAPGQRCVIAYHGNADLAAWGVPWAMELVARTNVIVVLPEYRGYGGLDGPPTVAGVRRDARAGYAAALRTIACASSDVVLYGHSLGSAVAAELATELGLARAPRALILESPFTSARDMAPLFVGAWIARLWSLIARVHYDTEARVRALELPVAVAHGEQDAVVPVWMGQHVYGAARHPCGFLLVPHGAHGDLPSSAGEGYWSWLVTAVGI